MRKTVFTALVLWLLSSVIGQAQTHQPADWLGDIPDYVYVANLSLPGTHDSGTSGLTTLGGAKVQDLTIENQLLNGVRVLDIRVNSDMKIAHGSAAASFNFESVLSTVESFLAAHPTEFVIIFTKDENVADNKLDAWKSNMATTVSNHASKIVPFHRDVTVGSLRGKMMLLNRKEFNDARDYAFAEYWGDNQPHKEGKILTNRNGKLNSSTTLWLQDNYQYDNNDTKDEEVLTLLNEAQANFFAHPTEIVWYVNFASGYNGSVTLSNTPCIKNATRVNKLVADNLTGTGPAGMIMMDFAGTSSCNGDALITALINNNFAYLTNPSVKLASFYNVGQGKYLVQDGKAAWGTRSTLGNHAMAVKMVSTGENTYKLHVINVSNGGDSQWLGTNCYTDGGATDWTFTAQGDGTYTFSNGSNFGWTGSQTGMDATGDNAKWQVITVADMYSQMTTATPATSIDVTAPFLSGNKLVRNNNAYGNSWTIQSTGSFTQKTDGDGNGSLNVTESWNGTFNVGQSVYLKKGLYRFTIDGFYRCGGKDAAKGRRQNGTETLNAYLYANGQTAPFKSIYDGIGVGNNLDGIVNNLTDAGNAIADGRYNDNSLYFMVAEDGYVDLGIKKEVAIDNNDWCAFNNFSLTYCGKPEIFGNATADSPIDMTSFIGDWHNAKNVQNFSESGNPSGESKDQTGKNMFEAWDGNAYAGKIYEYTLYGIPDGAYTFRACLMANRANAAHLYCGSSASDNNPDAEYGRYLSVTGVAKDGVLSFGVEQDQATANWFALGDWSLKYEGSGIPLEVLVDEFNALKAQAEELLSTNPAMNAAVKDALQSATEPASLSTPDAVNAAMAALTSAMEAAQASIQQYAASKEAIDNMYDLIAGTNVYTQQAYNAYKGLADSYKSQYDNGELTAEVYNPYKVMNWHTSPTEHSNFLLSAFGYTDYNANLYVNTWSSEGSNDGSNFTVPYLEYWTNDGNSLDAQTWTATVPDLTPGMAYQVSARVRVRLKNGASEPAGINMQVGDGVAADVTKGTSYDRFYVTTFTATGTADAAGNLTIKFNILDGNTISWLAIKNLNYQISIPNFTFEVSEAVDNHVCTYVKDIAGIGTNKSQAQPVIGWDIATNGDARAAGVFAYGSAAGLGGNKDTYKAPATGANGEEGNALGMVAVWGNTVQYVMPITLAAGTHTLKCDIYNSVGTTEFGKNLIGFIADNGTEYLSAKSSYPVGQWTKEEVTFTLTEATSGKISLGYMSSGGGSDANQHLFVDNIELPNVMIETPLLTEQMPANCYAATAQGYQANEIVLTDGADYTSAVAIAGDVTYVRTFGSANWQPWFAPFDVPLETMRQYVGGDEHADVIEFAQFSADAVVCHTLDKNGKTVLAANTPYLVRVKEDKVGNAITFTASGVEAAPAGVDPWTAAPGLYGTLRQMPMTEGGEADNDPWALSQGVFYQASHAGQMLKAFRVFLVAPQAQGANYMPVRVDSGAGIDAISVDGMEAGEFYDLQGRKVEHPTAGVYIFNGVKMLVK